VPNLQSFLIPSTAGARGRAALAAGLLAALINAGMASSTAAQTSSPAMSPSPAVSRAPATAAIAPVPPGAIGSVYVASLGVRSQPSEGAPSLGDLVVDDRVLVLDDPERDWVLIQVTS
jgi:hypothetical protein